MPKCSYCNTELNVVLGSRLQNNGTSFTRMEVNCECQHYSIPIDEYNIGAILTAIGISTLQPQVV